VTAYAYSATLGLRSTISYGTAVQTKADRRKFNMQKEVWTNGEKEMAKLIDYVKKIGLYQGI
jgi:hypothetical protein